MESVTSVLLSPVTCFWLHLIVAPVLIISIYTARSAGPLLSLTAAAQSFPGEMRHLPCDDRCLCLTQSTLKTSREHQGFFPIRRAAEDMLSEDQELGPEDGYCCCLEKIWRCTRGIHYPLINDQPEDLACACGVSADACLRLRTSGKVLRVRVPFFVSL